MKLCRERIEDAEKAATLVVNALKAAVYPQEVGNPFRTFAGMVAEIPVPEVFGGGFVRVSSPMDMEHVRERVIPLAKDLLAYAKTYEISSVLALFDQPAIEHALTLGVDAPYIPDKADLEPKIVESGAGGAFSGAAKGRRSGGGGTVPGVVVSFPCFNRPPIQ